MQNTLYSIIQTLNGEYVAAGIINGGWGVIKLEEYGNIVWQKTLSGFSNQANAVLQAPNNNFVVASNGLVVQIDTEGNVVWQTVVMDNNNLLNFSASSICMTPDGSYLLVGRGETGGEGGCNTCFGTKIIKMDNTGGILWERYFEELPTKVSTFIIPTTDGSYFLAGYQYFIGSIWGCPDVEYGFSAIKINYNVESTNVGLNQSAPINSSYYQQELVAQPNPLSENSVLKLYNNWRGNLSIRLVDTKGQTMKFWNVEKTAQLLVLHLETSELASGIYLVTLTNGIEKAACKVVKW